MQPKGHKKLTEREELFVEYYCSGGPEMSYAEAARRAGYSEWTVKEAASLAKKPHIKAAIDLWRENRARQFYISESQILERLWQEANYYDQGATHAGRINALVQLGKHLGMFNNEKSSNSKGSEGTGNTYNIIQYNTAKNAPETEKIQKAIKQKEQEVLEALEYSKDLEDLEDDISLKEKEIEVKNFSTGN